MNQSSRKARGFLNEAVWPNKISIRQDSISDSYAVETRPFARGKFATVRRCRHIESGKDYAAKYLRKRRRAEDVRHELIHEALVLAIANECERIVSLKEVFETSSEVILVLEMAAGGELQHVLDSEDCLPEASCRQLLRQICQGLAFLHKNNIAHLDIKPANLLLTGAFPQGEAKLCDFGISRLILPGEDILEIAGTPDYVAPEVLQYEPISLATDMWSLGILTYVLLTGHTPFGGDTKQDTYCNITLGEIDFPSELFEDISADAVRFIQQLVVKDPRKRLSIREVLSHPWLTDSSPLSIFVTSLSDGNSVDDNTSKPCVLPECETPSTSSMGSCESDNEMEDVKVTNANANTENVAPPNETTTNLHDNEAVIETQPSVANLTRDTSTQRIVETQSTDDDRNSIIDSASPAPEEELPSLQSSTSSSDSPVPAKKEKECENRLPPKKVSFNKINACCTKLTGNTVTPLKKFTRTSFPNSTIPNPRSSTTPSPYITPSRRSSDLYGNNKSLGDRSVKAVRSNSMGAVKTLGNSNSIPKTPHSLIPSGKALSSNLADSFKVPTTVLRTNKKPTGVPSVHTTNTGSNSTLTKRTSSTSLKRSQPSNSTSKVSKSNQSVSFLTKPSVPRVSLLSPTVSSTLKSCSFPLRTVQRL